MVEHSSKILASRKKPSRLLLVSATLFPSLISLLVCPISCSAVLIVPLDSCIHIVGFFFFFQ